MKKIKDSKGNIFISLSEALKHYNTPKYVYYKRINMGWTQIEAIEGRYIKDHLGNKFKSYTELCKYWNIDYSKFIKRIKRSKYNIKEALTKP